MATLNTYTVQYFKDKMVERFFPRKLIVSRNDDVFTGLVKDAFKKLNELVFQPRFYEFPISGDSIQLASSSPQSMYVDTSLMPIPGIFVKKVTMLVPANEFFYFFNDYRVILGRVVYPFNILRNQDNFIDFLLANELFKQLKKRFSNKNIDYFLTGDKIILGPSWQSIQKVVVFFLPGFDTENATEYELYDIEESFTLNFLEGLVAYREGRAQSEMAIMGELTTNATNLQTEGQNIMKKEEEEFKKLGFPKIGKRF